MVCIRKTEALIFTQSICTQFYLDGSLFKGSLEGLVSHILVSIVTNTSSVTSVISFIKSRIQDCIEKQVSSQKIY